MKKSIGIASDPAMQTPHGSSGKHAGYRTRRLLGVAWGTVSSMHLEAHQHPHRGAFCAPKKLQMECATGTSAWQDAAGHNGFCHSCQMPTCMLPRPHLPTHTAKGRSDADVSSGTRSTLTHETALPHPYNDLYHTKDVASDPQPAFMERPHTPVHHM